MHSPLLALWLSIGAGDGCPQPADPAGEAERLLAVGQATSAQALACAELAVSAVSGAPAAGQRVLARVLEDRGDWSAARSHFTAALEARRRARPRDRAAIAESLADVAAVDLRLGRRATAVRLLAELRPMAAPHSPLRPRLLMLEAQAARDDGAYERALTQAGAALQAWLALGANESARVATLNLLGELEWFLGRYEGARDWHRQALELSRAALGEGHPATGASLANLALTELALSDVAAALLLQRRALEITQTARGNEHPETLDRLQDLANLEVENGDYPAALLAYERVLELSDRRFGVQSDQSAHVLHNLGLLEVRLGRPARAAAWVERALVIWERLRGPRHPYVARALDQLANAAIELGQLDVAAGHLERAAALRARSGASERLGRAWNLGRLGDVRRRQGRARDAARLAAAALALCATEGSAQDKNVAPTLALLGDLEQSLGRAPEASARYRVALSISDRLYGREHPRSASLRARLGASLAQVGDLSAALEAADEAERLRRRHLRRTVRYLAESQALDFARQRPEGRDVLISIAAGAGTAPPRGLEAAFEAVVASRALVLDEMAARRILTAVVSSDDLGHRLETLRQRLAQLLYRQWERPKESRLALLQSTGLQLEQLERQAAARGASGRAEPPSEIRTDQLAAALPHKAALLSYVRYAHRAEPGVPEAERYVAFVLRNGDARPRLWTLGPAAPIEAAVANWRREVAEVAGALQHPVGAEQRALRAGRAVAAALWDPLASALGDRDLILVVPDGPLALLDLAALPDAEGVTLLDRRPVLHQLSAERDVLRWQSAPAVPASLLVLGGPDYDGPLGVGGARLGQDGDSAAPALRSSPCATTRALRFEFLPQAAAEGEALAEIWERAQGSPARLLLGSAATEGAFKRAAPAAGWLHLATHGFFDDPSCAPEPLVAGLRGSPADNPLLGAGLALAGANRREALDSGADDGILTAAEVAQLDLHQARWVVLSACGSGLGRVQQGEGVLGLQRAFVVAGADTVVMSLWPVDDRSTRLFMAALYSARLERGLSAAESLRAAQLELRERLRAESGAAPPALWAAFVAVGDWR